MPRARFFYGVSAGCGVGWLLFTLFRDGVTAYLIVCACMALVVGLILHQRYVRRSKGRRWRRTYV